MYAIELIRGNNILWPLHIFIDKRKMKPKEKKPEFVFRIIDNATGDAVGSYSRAYCDEYDFQSVDEARNANCHGTFKNTEQYRIAKYKVTYELVEENL